MHSYYSPGGYPPPPPRNNSLATASFVVGLVSLLCCAPLAIASIAMGIVALVQYPRNPYPNRWMAVTGVVLGMVLVLGVTAMLIFDFWDTYMIDFMDEVFGRHMTLPDFF